MNQFTCLAWVKCLLITFWAGIAVTAKSAETNQQLKVDIRVDASRDKGPLRTIWRYFGADEPNYAYMQHGSKLVGELGELAPQQVYFRAHNLLSIGDGTPALKWGSTNAYREDEKGRPIYDWTIVDRIFDTYLENGVRPYVEIGFMPEALSVKPDPYQHSWTPRARYEEIYTGWAHPPKDYDKWAELVFQWVKHSVERYGKEEVEAWYWETWNEANIPYWQGTPEEFRKLHDYAIDAVRRALPTARVGGPDTAGPGGQFMRDFLEHCLRGKNHATGKIGTPLDFIAFHAKGSPKMVDGHVRMGISNQLRNINDGFALVASFPELRSTPIIIGESDPEGCAACQGPQLAYRNGTVYSSYTAASFVRKMDLADQHGIHFEGALTWAFEFEDQPYFAGFRALASNGINKPVLNVFRMFGRMKGNRFDLASSHEVPLETMLRAGVREQPDISALASGTEDHLWIMLWHYHDDDLQGPTADISLMINSLNPTISGPANLAHYRIDEDHSNAFSVWKKMGSPQKPTAEQYAALDKADALTKLGPDQTIQIDKGSISLKVRLPRQGVSLLELKLK